MKVTFFGAAHEVGRSCIMVSTEKSRILLDAGIKLGEVEEHPTISDRQIKELNAIVISHAHLDHCGYLPHIFSAGYRGKVYATKPTIEIMNVMLSDYMRLSAPKDVTKEGLARMHKSMVIVEYKRDFKINDLTFRMFDAGHILGSAMVHVTDGKRSLLYTGDINLSKTKLFSGTDTHNLAADALITESTYGARDDEFPTDGSIVQGMMRSIKETLQSGGKVIIPSLAVGRGQEVLLTLDDNMNSGVIPKVPIYVDGMINKVMKIHRHNVIYCRKELQSRILMSEYDPFKSDNFHPVEKKSGRSAVAKHDGPCIIVTTSGMLAGGPVLYYLTKLAGDKNNKMMLVSYQAEKTLGREIQEGAKRVKVDNANVDIRLKVETYHLSGHAERRQLEILQDRIRGLKKVFIVHGDSKKSAEFYEDISKKRHAVLPKQGESFEL